MAKFLKFQGKTSNSAIKLKTPANCKQFSTTTKRFKTKTGTSGFSRGGSQIDTLQLVTAREDRVPIEVTMREGEVFRGSVDWESPNEIKLVLAKRFESCCVLLRGREI